MTNKRKQYTHALATKLNIPYQAADNLRRKRQDEVAERASVPSEHDDPTVYDLMAREPFGQELEKRKGEPIDEVLASQLVRVISLDRGGDDETALAPLLEADVDALPGAAIAAIAARFPTQLRPYFNTAAFALRRSQVLEWVKLRVSIMKRFPSRDAFFSHVRQQEDQSAYAQEIALMLAEFLFACYGEAPSSMPRERVLQGFAMAVTSGALRAAGTRRTVSVPTARGTLTVRIQKRALRQDGSLGYYVSVMPNAQPGDVLVETSFGNPTQQDAINDITKKLTASFHDGDAIVYEGVRYDSVNDAVGAIIQAQPAWQ